jgi:hypothetical protein
MRLFRPENRIDFWFADGRVRDEACSRPGGPPLGFRRGVRSEGSVEGSVEGSFEGSVEGSVEGGATDAAIRAQHPDLTASGREGRRKVAAPGDQAVVGEAALVENQVDASAERGQK